MWYTITSTEEWLSRLAKKYLGDAQRYEEIYMVNRDVMDNPDVVYPGLTIWIPIDGKPKPKIGPPKETVTKEDESANSMVTAKDMKEANAQPQSHVKAGVDWTTVATAGGVALLGFTLYQILS